MQPGGRELKTLHELHLKLRDVQAELTRGPRLITAKKQFVEKRKAEAAAARDRHKQLRVAADQKNLQLKSQEARIANHQAKMNEASSNREYDILKGQIAADEMSKSVLEDEILEALDQIDQAQKDIALRDAEVVSAEADAKKFEQDILAKVPGLETRRDELTKQLAQAETVLPADSVPMYRRLVQTYGADALAVVENRACSNCYVQLTQQSMLELTSGKVMFCRSCNRLMYAKPPGDE